VWLASWLEQNPVAGRTFAVFGALADKDVGGIVVPLSMRIDRWYLAGLDTMTPRGLSGRRSADACCGQLLRASAAVTMHADPREALSAAQQDAAAGDRVVAFRLVLYVRWPWRFDVRRRREGLNAIAWRCPAPRLKPHSGADARRRRYNGDVADAVALGILLWSPNSP
jgi:hypothetical protein